MNKAIKQVFLYITLLAIVGLVINFLLGEGTIEYITKVPIPNTDLYYNKFNVLAWKDNFTSAISDPSILQLEMPSRTWINSNASWLEEDFWYAVVNNLAFILDYIILGLNILIYPIRIVAYVLQNILAIIGFKITGDNKNWIVNLTQFLLNLQIPYTPH